MYNEHDPCNLYSEGARFRIFIMTLTIVTEVLSHCYYYYYFLPTSMSTRSGLVSSSAV